MSTPDYQHLRRLIDSHLSRLGIPDADWSCVKAESLYEARNAALPRSDVLAVWRVSQELIELYSENGDLLKIINLGPEETEQIAAA
jgi:hypothetical protein